MNINYRELFLSHLKLLYQFIEKVETSSIKGSSLLNARLVDDMLPLNVQVKIAANFALRACCPLSGLKYKELEGNIDSFCTLKEYVSNTIDYIRQITKPALDPMNINVKDTAGLKDISMSGTEYLYSFVLPNFFFHISMVYAIAKFHGMPVSKGDFDGIHHYPKEFSWEA